ncbi:SGNH/GDSL hydrolase family protein [Kineococcus sp. NUM-3379]
MPSTRRPVRAALALVAAAGLALSGTSPATAAPERRPAAQQEWVGAWAASPQRLPAEAALTGQITLRQLVHPTLGGSQVRIRLANTFGDAPLVVTKATVARAVSTTGPELVAGTTAALTFNGSATVSVPRGARMWSDPVDLPVAFGQDLAIDLQVSVGPGSLTGHGGAQGSWIAPGDAAGAPAARFTGGVPRWYFLDGVDVANRKAPGAVVALGDSITDGAYSSWQQNRRWTDVLATRLHELPAGKRPGVLNAGIGGNQITRDRLDCCPESVSALARLDRDVLAQSGVETVIVAEGINDVAYSVPAQTVIDGMTQIVRQAHAVGVDVVLGTITPYGCDNGCLTPEQERNRQAVNAWVRTQQVADGFVDFEKAVRDPQNPGRIAPAFDPGDHIHLNDAGYRAMGEAVDLALLR